MASSAERSKAISGTNLIVDAIIRPFLVCKLRDLLQLVLIKSSDEIEGSSRTRSECGVYCQESQANSIMANNSQVTAQITGLALRGEVSEQIIPKIFSMLS